MPKTIDVHKALNLIQLAVDEKGYNHISYCRYLDEGGKPQCIVGNALVRAGVNIDELVKFGANLAIKTTNLTSVHVTKEAALVFEAAQSTQDGRQFGLYAKGNSIQNPWYVALGSAQIMYNHLTGN